MSLLNIDFTKVVTNHIVDKKQYEIIIDDKLKVKLNEQFADANNQWNYTQIQLNIDELVDKHGVQVSPKKLYQHGQFYNILQTIDMKYSINKQIAQQKKLSKFKDLTLPQLGFIGQNDLKGDFDIKANEPQDQEYITKTNKFYQDIQNVMLDTVKLISKKKNISQPAEFIQQKSGSTDKGEWHTTRMTVKFQGVNQSKQSKDAKETYDQFINKKITQLKMAFPNNAIVLQKKDIVPDDNLDLLKCNSYQNKVYELHLQPTYLYGTEQDVESPYITRDAIISLFKDVRNNDIYKCLVQPQIQYGVRQKPSEDDPDTMTKYVKLNMCGIVLAIIDIQQNQSQNDPIAIINEMRGLWKKETATEDQVNMEMFGDE